jgi:ribose transport system ATP-binding protein
MVKAMVGRDIDLSYRDTSVSAGAEALRIENLSADGLFSDINITVRRGEIVGIAGLVGSGRTEIAQALLGLQKIQSGTVYINGNPRRFTSPKKALKSKVGMLPENRKEEGLVLNRSVEENGALCAVVTDSRAGYIPWRTISKRLRGILASLSVKYPHIDSEIRYLSGGNQQKVVLAKLLVTGCDIMILDEPTRGVDVGARKEMYLQMQQLRKQGKAMLMISSDLTEILSQSDRVYVMARGRVAGEFTHSEATEEKIMKLALNVPEGAV